MQIRSRLRRTATCGAALLTLTLAATAAEAQGKGKGGNAKGAHPSGQAKGKAKKHVSTGDAVIATREILITHGYQVVRVERVALNQVIYYRRGNNGRGKGLGPLQRMVVRPAGEVVAFESAPARVLVDINVRLGL
jgi:hypothetical protein